MGGVMAKSHGARAVRGEAGIIKGPQCRVAEAARDVDRVEHGGHRDDVVQADAVARAEGGRAREVPGACDGRPGCAGA
eukprot:2418384-Lingulodinium_polyedra.AAC.1